MRKSTTWVDCMFVVEKGFTEVSGLLKGKMDERDTMKISDRQIT
jgi:hypothetical protein